MFNVLSSSTSTSESEWESIVVSQDDKRAMIPKVAADVFCFSRIRLNNEPNDGNKNIDDHDDHDAHCRPNLVRYSRKSVVVVLRAPPPVATFVPNTVEETN